MAAGRGYLADKILELAQRYGIPIRQDKKLLQILSRLDLEEEIPPEVYKAVAEILAFIHRLSHWQMEKDAEHKANPSNDGAARRNTNNRFTGRTQNHTFLH